MKKNGIYIKGNFALVEINLALFSFQMGIILSEVKKNDFSYQKKGHLPEIRRGSGSFY